jgi:hypothetical protein
MRKYEVEFKIEVEANSPQHAAEIARDATLDPDSELTADVHLVEWNEDADDFIPNRKRGWDVRYRLGSIRPLEMIEWEQVE